jgi:hypothetical protein
MPSSSSVASIGQLITGLCPSARWRLQVEHKYPQRIIVAQSQQMSTVSVNEQPIYQFHSPTLQPQPSHCISSPNSHPLISYSDSKTTGLRYLGTVVGGAYHPFRATFASTPTPPPNPGSLYPLARATVARARRELPTGGSRFGFSCLPASSVSE